MFGYDFNRIIAVVVMTVIMTVSCSATLVLVTRDDILKENRGSVMGSTVLRYCNHAEGQSRQLMNYYYNDSSKVDSCYLYLTDKYDGLYNDFDVWNDRKLGVVKRMDYVDEIVDSLPDRVVVISPTAKLRGDRLWISITEQVANRDRQTGVWTIAPRAKGRFCYRMKLDEYGVMEWILEEETYDDVEGTKESVENQ